jgi:hypothetical protein
MSAKYVTAIWLPNNIKQWSMIATDSRYLIHEENVDVDP